MILNPDCLWLHKNPLVLASKSPTRRQLLQAAGIDPLLVAPSVDERAVEAPFLAVDEPPQRVAQVLATAKAKAVSASCPKHWVLGADQVLSLNGQLFHKPENKNDAREQLLALSGKTHHLHSALSLVYDGVEKFQYCGGAALTMRKLSDPFLLAYLAQVGRAVALSVGGYQLEGLGVHLFERVEGAHTTILGLPLLPLFAFWRQVGVLLG